MTTRDRGAAVAVLHCLLVLSVAGRYAVDRERLPRAWAQALPVDPNAPIRGRYVSLSLAVEYAEGQSGTARAGNFVSLSAQDGRLVATSLPSGRPGQNLMNHGPRGWTLWEPVAFYIPENVPDPARRAPGEELWVEVSVPPAGPPRPLRLAVKKDGVLRPLELQ